MGYKRQVFSGFSLNGFVTFATALAGGIKVIFLARLLSPHDFGVFSLVAVLLGSLEAFTETGINTTIIQSERSVGYFLDTAWVVSIFRGFAIGVLVLVAGIIMRMIYHEDVLLSLAAVAAFVPLIRGFINPAIVSLHKDMLFFRDSLYRLSLVIVDMICAIAFAFVLKSSMAFILGMVSAAVFEVAITFIFLKARPRFAYIPSRAKEIYQNAKSLNLAMALGYAVQNVDNLIVGKVVNTTSLGLYAQGYSLSHKFNLELSKSVQHATLPVYVRILKDKPRLRKAFWKSTLGSIGLFILASAPLIFFPKLFVDIILGGGKWIGVIPILPYLAIAGIIQSFVLLGQNLFTSVKSYFWLNFTLGLNAITMIFFILLWAPSGGLQGAVNGLLVSRIVTFIAVSLGVYQHFAEE